MGAAFPWSAESLKRGQQNHGDGDQGDDGGGYHARVAVPTAQSHAGHGRAVMVAGQAFARRWCHAGCMTTKPRDPFGRAGDVVGYIVAAVILAPLVYAVLPLVLPWSVR
jgi:hypothetical protein